MRPIFRVLADSRDITAAIKAQVLSLTVTDEAGMTSDTVEIHLSDPRGTIVLPRKGAELDVSLGYQETGLVAMGLYTVDEIELSGPPGVMVIRGKAADMRQDLKAQKTHAWENTTVRDLVGEIAAAHGLTPKVDPALGAIELARVDQVTESDLNLVTRLAQACGAVAKPANGCLLFVPAGKATTASGRAMGEVAIACNTETSWRAVLADRGKYKRVVASWHDARNGQRVPEEAGSGDPAYTLRETYPDAASARRAAEAQLRALDLGTGTVHVELPGRPAIAAECPVVLSGFRAGAGVDGRWVTTKVEHALSGSGLTTKLDAQSAAEGAV